MSNIDFKNQIKNLSMTEVMGVINQYGGFAKSCRFIVRINPPRAFAPAATGRNSMFRDLIYLCEAAEMPGRGFVSADVRYYGPNQKLPVQTQYEDTTMTFLCRSESTERQFFDDWMNIINPTNSFDFNYREDYETTIEIMQFAEYADKPPEATVGPNKGLQQATPKAPKETYRITLFNAFPMLVNPQPMTWADDQFQRLAVTFTYHKWKRENYWAEQPPKVREDGTFIQGATNIMNGNPVF